MRTRRSSLALALLALAAPTPLLAQNEADAAARSLEYGQLLVASDWDGAAAMMHPDALAQIRDLGELIVQVDPSGQAATLFFGDAASAMDEAADEELFAAFLSFVMEQAGLGAALSTMEQQAIGQVVEGDTVHVLSRTHMEVEGISISELSVASFAPHDGEWRMLLTAQIESFLAGMRSQLGLNPDALVN